MNKALLGLMFLFLSVSAAMGAQHDYVIGDQPGAAFRSDLNAVLQAIVTNNSSATEPATLYPNMWWYDSSAGLLKRRNNANDAWITLGLDAASTDGTFAANSDSLVPTQKAAKTYADTKASKGANSDITSLSGLTTPLSRAQGGLASTAANNVANGPVFLNASAQLPAVDGSLLTGISTIPGAGTITSTMLKTASGEVSKSAAETSFAYSLCTLPGGEYGFYPRVRVANTSGANKAAFGAARILGEEEIGGSGIGYDSGYVTVISLGAKSSSSGFSATTYANQRYVTASGTDLWIFILTDRATGDIISAYCAYDHPAYGNGGDFEKVSHPFASYDDNTQQIILVSKASSAAIKAESVSTGKSVLTLINEEYKVGSIDQEYIPLHSGKFLTDEGQQVKQMVTTIPDYIKVRALIKK